MNHLKFCHFGVISTVCSLDFSSLNLEIRFISFLFIYSFTFFCSCWFQGRDCDISIQISVYPLILKGKSPSFRSDPSAIRLVWRVKLQEGGPVSMWKSCSQLKRQPERRSARGENILIQEPVSWAEPAEKRESGRDRLRYAQGGAIDKRDV